MRGQVKINVVLVNCYNKIFCPLYVWFDCPRSTPQIIYISLRAYGLWLHILLSKTSILPCLTQYEQLTKGRYQLFKKKHFHILIIWLTDQLIKKQMELIFCCQKGLTRHFSLIDLVSKREGLKNKQKSWIWICLIPRTLELEKKLTFKHFLKKRIFTWENLATLSYSEQALWVWFWYKYCQRLI